MANKPAPWNWNDPIATDEGKATPEFLGWLSQQIAANKLIDSAAPQGRKINTGAGLTGGGDLTADRTISLSAGLNNLTDVLVVSPVDGQILRYDSASGKWKNVNPATVQSLLDGISSTRGTILYRGASGWEALAPGTAGQFLKTNGPGADPSWAAGGGGGGSGKPWYFQPPLASSFTAFSNDATLPTCVDDTDEGLLFDLGTPVAGDKHRKLERVIPNPSADWTVIAKVSALVPGISYSSAGLGIRDSVGGRMIDVKVDTGNNDIRLTRWNNGGSYSFHITYWPAVGSFNGWFKIAYTAADNTYRFYISVTGKNWVLVGSDVQTAFLTNKADRVGFGGFYSRGSGPNVIGKVEYWSQSW